ncbi:MAG: autotransporter domain-containing protein [Chlamydiales bacterium]|nr:autotransporter domain-containing protein [Chlamydiales bacterium]
MRKKYLLSALCLFSSVANATTLTWISTTTGGGTPNWSNPANWSPSVIPANGDSLFYPFQANAVGASDNDIGTLNITSFLFNQGYSVTGLPLTLGSGGSQGSAVVSNLTTLDDIFIANDMTFLNEVNFQVNGPSGQRLVLGGAIDEGGFNYDVTNSTGTLVLGGTVTNPGMANVQSGTLIVNQDTIPDDTVLGNQATINFNFDGITDGTYTGGFAGSGTIMKDGPRTLFLAGTNDSSAAMKVMDGTLQGDASTIKNDVRIAAPATVVFNQVSDGIFDGTMTGAGAVTKMASATLIMKKDTSYTGLTSIQGGTLEFQTPGPGGDVTLSTGTQLTLNPSTSGTLPGNITETGVSTVSKKGANAVALPGTSTVSNTQVNGGQLTVSGTLTSSATTIVNAGGSLATVPEGTVNSGSMIVVNDTGEIKGGGTFTGGVDVKKGGKVKTRGSIVTMNVVGNVDFAAGSILETELSPTVSSLLNVTGNVNITPGSTLSLVFEPGIYTPGTSEVAIQTTGTINTPPFTSVISNSAILSATQQFLPNQLNLIITASPFASVVTSGNAGAVAKCIDKIEASCSNSDMSTVIGLLSVEPDAASLSSALNQLQPALYKALTLTQENDTVQFANAINNRLEEQYQASCVKNHDTIDFWGDLYIDQMRQSTKGSLEGFHSLSSGVIVGVDRLFSQHTSVGAGVGYSHSNVDWNRSGGDDGRINSFFGSLYANYFTKRYFLNLALISGYSRYSAERRIDFSSIHRTAKLEDNGGYELMAHFSPGLLFKVKKVDLILFGIVDYVFLHQNSFTEKGAKSLNLSVKSSRSTLWREELGLEATRCITLKSSKWIPLVKLGVVQENRPSGGHYSASFHDTSCCTFTVKGLNPNHTLVAPSIALTGLWFDDRLVATVRYDAELGHKYQNQRGNLQVGYAF